MEKASAPAKPKPWYRNVCICCAVFFTVIIGIFAGIAAYWVTKIIDSFGMDEKYARNITLPSEGAISLLSIPNEHLLQQKLPHNFGYDRNNLPVLFVEFGQWDLGRLAKDREGIEFVVRAADRMMLTISNNMRARSTPQKPVRTFGIVSNLEGYGFAKALDHRALGLLQEIVKRHYEKLETVEYFFIINMPTRGRAALRLMGPFLGNLLEKFEYFGTDGWLSPLLQKISEDQLPSRYHSLVQKS